MSHHCVSSSCKGGLIKNMDGEQSDPEDRKALVLARALARHAARAELNLTRNSNGSKSEQCTPKESFNTSPMDLEDQRVHNTNKLTVAPDLEDQRVQDIVQALPHAASLVFVADAEKLPILFFPAQGGVVHQEAAGSSSCKALVKHSPDRILKRLVKFAKGDGELEMNSYASYEKVGKGARKLASAAADHEHDPDHEHHRGLAHPRDISTHSGEHKHKPQVSKQTAAIKTMQEFIKETAHDTSKVCTPLHSCHQDSEDQSDHL